MREWPEDEWLAFFAEMALSGKVKGRRVYLPSPSDIEKRAIDLRWLRRYKFPASFIVNVLELDNPTIDRVKQMVKRYGSKETYRRCQPFMASTEYDVEESMNGHQS